MFDQPSPTVPLWRGTLIDAAAAQQSARERKRVARTRQACGRGGHLSLKILYAIEVPLRGGPATKTRLLGRAAQRASLDLAERGCSHPTPGRNSAGQAVW
eukprot:CAMPEP_0174936566 /NCGR_PEP_ID=MMETSP1355-20121228/57859_1 /TAXON_ID=464990 /ORGANISM="Hemiselmis tepida, Strain CCMP443" /LENGTH=99 /DNA_ID=CAMNT_0016183349 /DNA_START=18 /DNA_END=315 /DNA_ORIENTATION=+